MELKSSDLPYRAGNRRIKCYREERRRLASYRAECCPISTISGAASSANQLSDVCAG